MSNLKKSTDDALCSLCSEALILDDMRAGGAVQHRRDGSTPALDFTNFALDEWQPNFGTGSYYTYWKGSRAPARERDHMGWVTDDPFDRDSHRRRCVAEMAGERCITPPALPKLVASSTTGEGPCRFCCRLKQLFCERYERESWWEDGLGAGLQFRVRYEWMGCRVGTQGEPVYELENLAVVVRHPGLGDDNADVFKFTVAAWPGTCRDWLGITRFPLDDEGPTSKGNINLIKSWIEDCEGSHERCKETTTTKSHLVPTRLLDLCPDSDDENVALIDDAKSRLGDGLGRRLRYAALSYCWGSTVPLTTSTTLAKHKAGIPIASLPPVFSEARLVARKLGLRYLWIDALCIVQDSRADWERESVQMSDIFTHSFITICAASSTACDQSFLRRPAKPTISVPFHSHLQPDIAGQYCIFLDGQLVGEEEADFSSSRWDSRAWVWQEKEMAARSLIFGSSMLQMRCRQRIRLEDGLNTVPWHRAEDISDNDSAFWFSGISDYSQRALTYPRDRLSAVSGVARFISRALKDAGRPTEYLAGLWLNESFAQQLCWVLPEPKQSFGEMMDGLGDEETYRTPSWSWASRNQEVAFRRPLGFSTVFQVVRWDLSPAGLDATIAVKPGSSITLRGKLATDPLVPPEGALLGSDAEEERGRYDKRGKLIKNFGRIYYEFDWVENNDDAENARVRGKLRLFVTCERHWARIYGLVLVPVGKRECAVYRRVGVFSTRGNYLWLKKDLDVEVTIV